MFPYIMLLVGVVIGAVLTKFIGPKTVGTIRLFSSQPGELPSMYVELNRPVEGIVKLKKVQMDISHK